MIEGRLHHVSIIVPDEERAHELAATFGLKLGRRQFVSQYEADCIFTEGTHGVVEFIIATGGKLAKFNKGVGGLHHIAIEVEDLTATTQKLAESGIELLEKTPVDAGPIRINFMPPAYTRGTIVEYVERVKKAGETASPTSVPGAASAPSPTSANIAAVAAAVAPGESVAGGGRHFDAVQKDDRAILREARDHRKHGRADEGAKVLCDALRRGWLTPEGVEQAGRQIASYLKEVDTKGLRVLVLGQCTTSWVTSCLTAAAWAGGTTLRASDGQYDNVIQELMTAAASGERYDAVVLLPWSERLLGSAERDAEQRIADELAFWQKAWELVAKQMSARLVQVGYDWVSPGPLGHHLGGKASGPVSLVRRINEAMRAALPPSAFFVDLEQTSGLMGRERFYDSRRYFWTKQPFSEAGSARLARHIWAGIRAMVTGPKKVLVLDLDNTLWGGVVGETGPLGVELGEGPAGEAFRAFQDHVKALARRGTVLAVSSKNNPDDAREPFQKNPAMRLSLEDFAAFEATWDPKSVAIRRMAQTLQLGLDSFVFFDDNPAEREHVRQMVPEVEVVDVPEDPADYIRALEADQWFEAVAITAEDRERTEQYRAEAQRREVQGAFGSMDEYLTSLEMIGDVRSIDDADLSRVVQLLGKTNQFNLTTRRHGLETVREMLARPRSVAFTVRISDRFGDYGLVAVLMGVEEPGEARPTLRMDTWLMSCRVIGRTAEEFCLACLADEAKKRGYERILGHYIPTKKNALVVDLYDRLGFRRLGVADDKTVSYELELSTATLARTFLSRNR